jgi:ERCC4-type nuclease
VIVSPTEPASLRYVGTVSMEPEDYGCDITVTDQAGLLCGIQRKEFRDLCNSLDDGRLGEQVAKMRALPSHKMLIVEGAPEWSDDGQSMGTRLTITRKRYDSALWTIQAEGIWVCFTKDLDETIRVLQHFEVWVTRDHKDLATRPQPGGMWGKATSQRDWRVHLLTGLPGVGPVMAGKIIDHCGMPWALTVTEEQLLQIEGLGPKKVAALMAVLQ